MAGEGDPGTAGGGGGAGGISPPGQPGAPPAQQGGSPPGGAGAPAVGGIPLDVLPEALRGRPTQEVKFLLQQMVTATHNTAEENKRLKGELENARKAPPKEEPKKPTKPLEELVLEDAEAAIAAVIEKRFGGEIGRLNEGYGESMYSSMRSSIPDFKEYEDEVREVIKASGAPPDKNNLTGAYLMAVGKKTVEGRRQDQQSRDNVEHGGAKPGGDDSKPPLQLSQLEQEVARGMNMTNEQYAEEKQKWESGTFDIKVPTGKAERKAS